MIKMITGFDMLKLWFMVFVIGGFFLVFGYVFALWLFPEEER